MVSPSSRRRFLQLEEEAAFLPTGPAEAACRAENVQNPSTDLAAARAALLSSMAAFNFHINCLCTAIFFLPLITNESKLV